MTRILKNALYSASLLFSSVWRSLPFIALLLLFGDVQSGLRGVQAEGVVYSLVSSLVPLEIINEPVSGGVDWVENTSSSSSSSSLMFPVRANASLGDNGASSTDPLNITLWQLAPGSPRLFPPYSLIKGISIRINCSSNEKCSSGSLEFNKVSLSLGGNQPYSYPNSNSVGTFCGPSSSLSFGNSSFLWGASNSTINAAFNIISEEENISSVEALLVAGWASGSSSIPILSNVALQVYSSFAVNVTGVFPSTIIGLSGGENVTISGGPFLSLSGISCKIGFSLGTVVEYNLTSITCTVPGQRLFYNYSVAVSLMGDDGPFTVGDDFYLSYVCNRTARCNGNGNCAPNGSCICDFGWTGTSCYLPDCSSLENCNFRGKCIAGPACNCSVTSNWIGKTCAEPSCSLMNHCSGHGVCVSPQSCQCDSGWLGPSCNIGNCSLSYNCNEANHGGTCIGNQTCQCNSGFSGPNCFGNCTSCDKPNYYCASANNCTCVPGYTLESNCTSTYSCQISSQCNGNGICINTETCQCYVGWTGSDCSKENCSIMNGCNGNGNCTNPFTCECTTGWTGATCNVASCPGTDNCNVLNGAGSCIPPTGCTCEPGWTTYNCSVPACTGVKACNPNQKCIAPDICECIPGTYTKTCEPIYSCIDLNFCSGNGNCTGDSECDCVYGWTTADNCSIPDCTPLDNCYQSEGHGFCSAPFTCTCNENWTGGSCDIPISSGSSSSSSPVISNSSTNNIGLIIGLVVGGLVILIGASVALAFFFVRKYRRRPSSPSAASQMSSQHNNAVAMASLPMAVRGNSNVNYDVLPVQKYAKNLVVNSSYYSGFVIRWSDLILKEKVGIGAFGSVFHGELNKTDVAVKQLLKEDITQEDIDDFLLEAETMKALPMHPNVILFRGITIPPDPLSIVTDFCEGGSLINYLIRNSVIPIQTKLQFIKDIVRGMLHLHHGIKGKEVIHRDLAARNILLREGRAIITDFGMSRIKEETEDSKNTTQDVGPLKWMSPEAFLEKKYSTKSDVFSFGVVIYEIIAQREPWEGLDPIQASHRVSKGERLKLPNGCQCPVLISSLMIRCWMHDPADRPEFSEICELLDRLDNDGQISNQLPAQPQTSTEFQPSALLRGRDNYSQHQ